MLDRYIAAILGAPAGLWVAVQVKLDAGATFASLTAEDYWWIAGAALGLSGTAQAIHKARHKDHGQALPQVPTEVEQPDALTNISDTTECSPELLDSIKWAEGFRAQPYYCSEGRLTIGYGHNIEANPVPNSVFDRWKQNGIPEHEASDWLKQHIDSVIKRCREKWPWLDNAGAARRDVIYDMAYNMGVAGLSAWPKTLAAAKRGDWVTVARFVAKSRYFQQVGRRGRKNVAQIKTGQYQPLGATWDRDDAKPFKAYLSGDTIMIRRIWDNGYFSTGMKSIEDAKRVCDENWQKDQIGAESADIDWSEI